MLLVFVFVWECFGVLGVTFGFFAITEYLKDTSRLDSNLFAMRFFPQQSEDILIGGLNLKARVIPKSFVRIFTFQISNSCVARPLFIPNKRGPRSLLLKT